MWLILHKSELYQIKNHIPETSENSELTEIRKINGGRYKVVRNEDGSIKAAYWWAGDPYSSHASGVGFTSTN